MRKRITIELSKDVGLALKQVKELVECVSQYRGEVNAVSKHYCVNCKSIMGLYSLDLSKPIKMEFEEDEDEGLENLIANNCKGINIIKK